MAGKKLAQFVVRVFLSGVDDLGRRQNETGDAEAALDRARLAEGIGVDFLFKVGKALDGDDGLALQLVRLRDAGLRRLAVDEHVARAARALAAAVLHARQMQLIAQKANELLVFLRRDRLSVDNKLCHLRTSVDHSHNNDNYFGLLTNFIVLQAQARCNTNYKSRYSILKITLFPIKA